MQDGGKQIWEYCSTYSEKHNYLHLLCLVGNDDMACTCEFLNGEFGNGECHLCGRTSSF
jgi:hypothetical protein